MTANDREVAEIAKLRADASKAEAEAEKLRADGELARWKSLVPDFGAVKRGALTAPAEKAVSATLAYRALGAAAKNVADAIEKHLGQRVLVTSDIDLAASAAAYLEVNEALETLSKNVKDVLSNDPEIQGYVIDAPAIAAAVSALPGLLSLFSVNRTVSVANFNSNDTAAAALVAGALLGHESREIIHDDFRLPTKGAIWKKVEALADQRIKVSTALRKATPSDDTKPSEALALRLSELKTLLAAIDAMDARLRSKSDGVARSPLTEASLYEELYTPRAADGATTTVSGISHVLLVKSEGGQVVQATDQGWLHRDQLMLLAEAAVTYMLLDVGKKRLVAAGNKSGMAQATGSIGDRLKIDLFSGDAEGSS
jgi:hypothetical protein